MNIYDIIQALDVPVSELLIVIFGLMTVIQIVPIKINPWSWIAMKLGRAINSEVIQKVEDLEKQVKGIEDQIKTVEEKAEEREAINCRVRILRFNDELREDRKHTKDSFDQVLSDVNSYNKYCKKHEDFKNEQTVATVAYIRKCYDARLEKHDFL